MDGREIDSTRRVRARRDSERKVGGWQKLVGGCVEENERPEKEIEESGRDSDEAEDLY